MVMLCLARVPICYTLLTRSDAVYLQSKKAAYNTRQAIDSYGFHIIYRSHEDEHCAPHYENNDRVNDQWSSKYELRQPHVQLMYGDYNK